MANKSIWIAIIAGSIAAAIALSTFALSFPTAPSSTTTINTEEDSSNSSLLLDQILERSVTTRVLENGTKVTSFRNPSGFDESLLKAYIEKKSAELNKLSNEQPNKEVMVAVSFKHPMIQAEIDEIITLHSLKVDYFEYVATNNVSGGASTIAYPNLEKAQEGMTRDATIIGATYLLAFGKASEFEKLNQNDDVILADIGFFIEIEEARRQGEIAYSPNTPRNLYQEFSSLGLLAEPPQ